MRVLENECGVTRAWAPTSGDPETAIVSFVAIWDTGATHSVITQAVVDACGLIATGMTTVHHVDGSSQAETYLVNIVLPNRVGFAGIRVTKATGLTGSAEMLIGMDIISRGDFAVTSFNGNTKFSFRYPSIEHIDFIQQGKRTQFQHGGKPNPKRARSPNPSGRGKNKKKRNRKK